jgi:hypothetical protein
VVVSREFRGSPLNRPTHSSMSEFQVVGRLTVYSSPTPVWPGGAGAKKRQSNEWHEPGVDLDNPAIIAP